MAERPAATAALAALLATGLGAGLAGCDTQMKRYEGELTGLLAVLPGRYDNSKQIESEPRGSTKPPVDAVAITILHVYTPRLGHHVYYARETAADNPQRIFSQQVYTFDVDEKLGIVETIYEFAEPQRWLAGMQDKDLFTSIVREDVRQEGCQLLWKKTDTGYTATHDQRVCPDEDGGKTPQVSLNAGVLTIGDYKFRRSR